jgi:hypothetical protein
MAEPAFTTRRSTRAPPWFNRNAGRRCGSGGQVGRKVHLIQFNGMAADANRDSTGLVTMVECLLHCLVFAAISISCPLRSRTGPAF